MYTFWVGKVLYNVVQNDVLLTEMKSKSNIYYILSYDIMGKSLDGIKKKLLVDLHNNRYI